MEIGYSVLLRNFVGDEETTRETRIIKCTSLEDFKKKMQDKAIRSYNKGNDTWKLEAPQIFESSLDPEFKNKDIDVSVLHYTDFCDEEPLLIWKEKTYDFSSRLNRKLGE